jgi:ankyrin repeat protein
MSGQYSLVAMLLKSGADANAELLNGRTPLHVAAETGNEEAARCLLEQPRIRRAVKDRFGNTPLLIAAQHGKRNIAEMLAPWNHMSLLSEEVIEAAKQFNATIVDFGHFRVSKSLTTGDSLSTPMLYCI